jgi:ankyrin repeat protein
MKESKPMFFSSFSAKKLPIQEPKKRLSRTTLRLINPAHLTLLALQLTTVWASAIDLFQAAEAANISAARSILQTNAAAALLTNLGGETALHVAVRKRNAGLVRLLLEYKPNVNAADDSGFTPLLNAAENGELPLVEALVQHGADLAARNKANNGAFALAAGSTNRMLLEWLAEKLPVLDPKDKVAALQAACGHGRLASVRWLLQKGVPAAVTNSLGTPLHFASMGPDMIARVRQGKQSQWPDGETGPEEDYVQIVSLLLTNGAEVDAVGYEGRTPLHEACTGGCLPTAKLLLRHRANVRARTDLGKTPLHQSAAFGNYRLVELLLANGADLEARDNYGFTPLREAASTGNLTSLKALLAHDAKVTVYDRRYGATPLHWAAMSTNVSVVAALLDAKANINARDMGQRTPLHQAASLGREPIVRLLLERGAKVSVMDAAGDTPERLARRAGFPRVAEMLGY